jgi:hypothetical protein
MPSFAATRTVHVYVAFILALQTELLQADQIWYVFRVGFANFFSWVVSKS